MPCGRGGRCEAYWVWLLSVAVGTVEHSGRGRDIPWPIFKFVARRIAAGIATLLVVSILIFLATSVLPGNAAEAVLGHNATAARVEILDKKLGLDRSVISRYGSWLADMLHGDFGKSAVAIAEDVPNPAISASIGTPLLNSLILAAITTALLIPLTLVLGVIAGVRAGKESDHVISVPALISSGLPEFVTATFLVVVFSTSLGWLPPVEVLSPGASSLSSPPALVLPVATLLAVALGSGIRQVRAGMIEAMDQDFVQVARLNGVRRRHLLFRYGLRNAIAPSVQSIAQNIQYLVGGIIIVESVYNYPGVGTYLVQAVSSRDVTEVQAAALILAAIYIGINIVADLIVVLIVPKLRTELT